MRPGAEIAEPGKAQFAIAAHPLGHGLAAHLEPGGSRLERRPLAHHHFGHLFSTKNHESGILVVVHSVSLENLIARHNQCSRSDRMDNLLKPHT